MGHALFINGVYEGVLNDILTAQETRGGGESYLQPYKGQMIALLRKQPPSHKAPVRLYVSTTGNLSQVCFTAEIVRWEDKRTISNNRRKVVRRHLKKYQTGEIDLFSGTEVVGQKAVNLITIRDLKQLDTLHSTAILCKVSDGLPLKKRTVSGGWSEVFDLGDLVDLRIEAMEQHDSVLANAVSRSARQSEAALRKRLSSAAKIPQKVQVISVGYRRNPDVIVAVLRRAKGICEKCKSAAPFLKQSDGSPYLEVHHCVPLSQGGEDTTMNAAALCPNCHRKLHHGRADE